MAVGRMRKATVLLLSVRKYFVCWEMFLTAAACLGAGPGKRGSHLGLNTIDSDLSYKFLLMFLNTCFSVCCLASRPFSRALNLFYVLIFINLSREQVSGAPPAVMAEVNL